MTGPEIVWELHRLGVTPQSLAESGAYYCHKLPAKVYEELGPIVEVDRYGGEGQGDEWYTVLHFVNHNVYIRVKAFYNSDFDSVEFYGSMFEAVYPQEQTITVYERKESDYVRRG